MSALHWQAVSSQLPAATFAVSQLPKLAWPAIPAAFNSLSSWQCVVEGSAWLMGRRDKRTCKGKVFKGSSGNVRQLTNDQGCSNLQCKFQNVLIHWRAALVPYHNNIYTKMSDVA